MLEIGRQECTYGQRGVRAARRTTSIWFGWATICSISMTDVSSLAATNVPTSQLSETTTADVEQIAFALSHDFQAPLNSLASHAETLTTGLESESGDLRNGVKDVDGLTKRMQQMLDGIQDYSMLNSLDGKRDIVSLDSVLEEAIGNLRSSMDESGVTIEHQPLPALGCREYASVR